MIAPEDDTLDRFRREQGAVDAYFSADVETDGPIPGPYSMLSFAIVYAGSFDGTKFVRPKSYEHVFYRELRPISAEFQADALRINGLDRDRLVAHGGDPATIMTEAGAWICATAGSGSPVLVAYPLSFDWTWLYWYFTRFCPEGSPFGYSRCFDIKTAVAVKSRVPIIQSSRSRLSADLLGRHQHPHHAIDDAISQAQTFANVFEWGGADERAPTAAG
jgi:hypothetical protein